MRPSLILILLSLLLAPATASYVFIVPVDVHSSTNPEVLMPGDAAVLSIELDSGAAQNGAGTEILAGPLSTPINETLLRGSNFRRVRDGPDKPRDSRQGRFISGEHSSADVPTKPSINLNVANPRANTVNAVTIVPSAPGIRFSPDQNYIGTMDPDEVFTTSFGIDSDNPAKPLDRQVNLSFVAKFKNRDTWHESEKYVTSYMPPKDNSRQNGHLLPAGAGVLIMLVAGSYLYWRKKMSNKPVKNDPRSA